jgi:3-oxoacyl-[acyl-carrier protein] reductase
MTLEGKIIIVTGGSDGIGLSVSKKIALEGGTVIICSRDKNKLKNAERELKKLSNNIFIFSVDISKFADVELLHKFIKKKFGKINGIVNCAGVYGPIGKTTEVNMQDFLKTIEINLMGTIYMCNIFSDLFSSEHKRKIVNFSGGGAANPFPNYSAYAASKAAIVRFTENLSIELTDDNFDVNCVAPGFVATKLHQQTLDTNPNIVGKEFYDSTKKQIENGAVPAEKAADLVSFLLSNDSNGITGKFISAPWDSWQDKEFQELLKTDKDFATLRRIDNKTYFKR